MRSIGSWIMFSPPHQALTVRTAVGRKRHTERKMKQSVPRASTPYATAAAAAVSAGTGMPTGQTKGGLASVSPKEKQPCGVPRLTGRHRNPFIFVSLVAMPLPRVLVLCTPSALRCPRPSVGGSHLGSILRSKRQNLLGGGCNDLILFLGDMLPRWLKR